MEARFMTRAQTQALRVTISRALRILNPMPSATTTPRTIHAVTADDEMVCGARSDWPPEAHRAATPNCEHCLAWLRCRAGEASDHDRVTLATPGHTDATAGRVLGPLETCWCPHHPTVKTRHRWTWVTPAAGQTHLSALQSSGSPEIIDRCPQCTRRDHFTTTNRQSGGFLP